MASAPPLVKVAEPTHVEMTMLEDDKPSDADGQFYGLNANPDECSEEDVKRAILQIIIAKPNCTFKLPVFLKILFYHTFMPFSLPIAFCVETPIFRNNLQFSYWPTLKNWKAHVFLASTRVALWIALFLLVHDFFNLTLLDIPPLYAFPNEVTFACAGFFAHRVMIAVKYAFMPPDLLELYSTHYIPDVIKQEIQLVSGWTRITAEHAFRELELAQHVVGCDLRQTQFIVKPSPLFYLSTYGRDPERAKQDAAYDKQTEILLETKPRKIRTPAFHLASNLVQTFLCEDGLMYKDARASSMAMLFPLSLVCVPIIGRLVLGSGPFGENSTTIVYAACCAYVTMIFYVMVTTFIFIAVVDYKQRHRMLVVLAHIVHSPHSKLRTSPSKWLVRMTIDKLHIDLSNNNNVISWFNVRQVITNFGNTYRKRLQVLFAWVIFVNLISVIRVVLELIREPDADSSRTLSELAVWSIGPLWHAGFFALQICKVIFYGSRANSENQKHIKILRRFLLLFRTGVIAYRNQQRTKGNIDSDYDTLTMLDDVDEEEEEEEKKEVKEGKQSGVRNRRRSRVLSVMQDDLLASAKSSSLSPSTKLLARGRGRSVLDGDRAQSLVAGQITSAQCAELESCVSLLQEISRSLNIEDQTDPVTIMGVRCSTRLLTLIGSGLVTIVAATIELMNA